MEQQIACSLSSSLPWLIRRPAARSRLASRRAARRGMNLAESHLSTAVDLTDPELDLRLIRILPPPEPILTGQRQVGTGLKRVVQRGRSVGELDLGPVADRVDDSDARGGRNIDGLAGLRNPGADRKPEPSHLAPCSSHPDRPDRDGRTASRGATWRGGRALGGRTFGGLARSIRRQMQSSTPSIR
jgi:hypothetical protein